MKHWIVAAAAGFIPLACNDDNPADLAVETVEESVVETTETTATTTESSVAATASLAAPAVTEPETTPVPSTAVPTTDPPTTVRTAEEPLATWEGDPPLTDIDGNPMRMRVDLLELSRAGDVVTLRWATHLGEETFYINVDFGESGGADSIDTTSGVHLLDLVNGNKHLTLIDDERKFLCSSILNGVEPGQRVELYAQFAAPPADVTSVSVVIPNVPPFEDEQITEGSG